MRRKEDTCFWKAARYILISGARIWLNCKNSKNLVELTEIKEQELKAKAKQEFHTDSVQNIGRPKILTSIGSVANEIGIPKQSLYDAKQHVAAVEEFPPLENLPKYQAIQTAKELRKAPPEAQDKILDFAQKKSKHRRRKRKKISILIWMSAVKWPRNITGRSIVF